MKTESSECVHRAELRIFRNFRSGSTPRLAGSGAAPRLSGSGSTPRLAGSGAAQG